jgi:hypothetical protein
MSLHPSHQEYLESLRERSVLAAHAFLAGEVSMIETVRILLGLLEQLDDPELEKSRTVLEGIVSDTDHLPIGPVREKWATAALVEADAEIVDAESVHTTIAAEACRAILDRLEPAD